MILNQTVDVPQTFITQSRKRSNSVQLSSPAHISGESFMVFFDQVEQLRQQLLKLKQENKQLVQTNRALKKQISDLQQKLSSASIHCALCNNAIQQVPNENSSSTINLQLKDFIEGVRASQPVDYPLHKNKRTLSCQKDKIAVAVRQSLPTRKITFLKNEGKHVSLKRKQSAVNDSHRQLHQPYK